MIRMEISTKSLEAIFVWNSWFINASKFYWALSPKFSAYVIVWINNFHAKWANSFLHFLNTRVNNVRSVVKILLAILKNVVWSRKTNTKSLILAKETLKANYLPFCRQHCACWWPDTTRCQGIGWYSDAHCSSLQTLTKRIINTLRPGTHFTNEFSITIQIRWKFHLALTQLLVIISRQNLAHDTTAQLSCHVPNIVAITLLVFGWEQNKISITFELWWKNR